MADYKTHIFAGLILSLSSLIWFKFDIDFFMIPLIGFIIFIFSQLPDIDHQNSKITWNILNFGVVLLLVGQIINILSNFNIISSIDVSIFGVWFLIIMILFAQTKHRGITHTTWFVFLVPLSLLLIPNLPNTNVLIIFAIISGWSHLIMDGYIFKFSLKPKSGKW